jgi:hypothetical protein
MLPFPAAHVVIVISLGSAIPAIMCTQVDVKMEYTRKVPTVGADAGMALHLHRKTGTIGVPSAFHSSEMASVWQTATKTLGLHKACFVLLLPVLQARSVSWPLATWRWCLTRCVSSVPLICVGSQTLQANDLNAELARHFHYPRLQGEEAQNVAEMVVARGFANVIRHRSDEVCEPLPSTVVGAPAIPDVLGHSPAL